MSDPRTEPSAAQPPIQPPPVSGPTAPVPTDVGATSDDMLLLGARLRDESALVTLFDRHGGLLYTLALRMLHDRDLAEEVVQDVFLRCWHGREHYDATRDTSLPIWLLGITRRRAVEVLRWRQIQGRPSEPEQPPRVEEREPATPGDGDEAELQETVRAALAELPEPQRATIELAYYGGLTQTEIADRLGAPLGTVKLQLRDGVRRLRRLLGPLADAGAPREGGRA